MRKAFMIGSLTAFIAVAAFAAPRRDVAAPQPAPSEEVAEGSGDVHITKPADEKTYSCPCSKGKGRK